jgi:type IV pilus assembly protein PilO
MSIIDDLRALDTNDPGRWPLPFRVAAVAIAFVAVIAIGIYYFVWLDDKPTLDREKRKETELKAVEDRQRKPRTSIVSHAARRNRARFRRDVAPAGQDRGAEPARRYLAMHSALASEKLFQPTGEVQRTYAELPISFATPATITSSANLWRHRCAARIVTA